jgi:hypothetical protein
MRNLRYFILVPAAVLAAACGRDDSSKRVDDALNADLSLAAQARPYTPMDSISAMEQQGLMQPIGYAGSTPVYRQPTYSAPRRTTTTTRRSTSSGTYYPAPARRTTVVKHTKRDAAIGAGAGAVIGAVTSRDKVKGAVIGGVTGAILGGIIGNNVDKTRR